MFKKKTLQQKSLEYNPHFLITSFLYIVCVCKFVDIEKKTESYNVPPYSIPSPPPFTKYLLPYPVGISVDDP